MKRSEIQETDKSNYAASMESALKRKVAVNGLRIHYEEGRDMYVCVVKSKSEEQNPGGLEIKVAEYFAGKCGLSFYPVDMSHPGDEPFSEEWWLWAKHGEFKNLDVVEEWVRNFATHDVKRVEELYHTNLSIVTKKLIEKS